jgi:hypothetical protein
MKEFYPIASDATICNGLNFNSAPGPVDDDIIEDPLNIDEEFPSVEVLEGKYLSGGKPVVVRGIITPNYVL